MKQNVIPLGGHGESNPTHGLWADRSSQLRIIYDTSIGERKPIEDTTKGLTVSFWKPAAPLEM